MSADGEVIEKVMALTPAEFAASAARLIGREVGPGPVDEPLSDGRVTITCTPRTGVRLGGLLELPRALVSIRFTGVGAAEREAFMRRFDLAFQRGGG